MPPSPHRIRRLRFTARTGDAAEASALRAGLREVLDDALREMGDVFDQIGEAGETVRIPRLELALRVDSLTELPVRLARELRHLFERRSGIVNTPLGEIPQKDWQRQAGIDSQYETLLTYLMTGYLPWHAMQAESEDIVSMLTEAVGCHFSQLLSDLARLPAGAPFFRLVQLLPGKQIMSCGERLCRERETDFKEASGTLLRELVDHGAAFFTERQGTELLASWLHALAALNSSETAPCLTSVAENNFPGENKKRLQHFIGHLQRLGLSANVLYPALKEGGKKRQPSAAAPDNAPFIFFDNTKGDEEPAKLRGASRQKLDGAAELWGWQVFGAGLILLHPFLPRFFNHLGVMAPEARKPEPASLPRAAALLHYLSHGRRQVYEFELGLIKVLLGLHPQDPLPVCGDELEPDDMEEAEVLIGAVIDHWQALKNTSVSGLRATFLQRAALLQEKEDGYHLRVERTSFDLLLEKLPWSVNIIKFAWMAQPLYTEW